MKMKNPSILALALLAAAAPLFAQKQAPPEAGPAKDFRVPAPRETSRFRTGSASRSFRTGTCPRSRCTCSCAPATIDETADQVWLSDLDGRLPDAGDRDEGSATQIAETAARMGGSIDVTVGPDRTDIGGDVLSEFGPDMAKLVADVVAEREVPRDGARAPEGRPRPPARDREHAASPDRDREIPRRPLPEPPLRPALPDARDGSRATRSSRCARFHAANFGAARARLYVVGRFDDKAVEAAVRSAFGDWKRGAEPVANAPKAASERAVYIVDRPEGGAVHRHPRDAGRATPRAPTGSGSR